MIGPRLFIFFVTFTTSELGIIPTCLALIPPSCSLYSQRSSIQFGQRLDILKIDGTTLQAHEAADNPNNQIPRGGTSHNPRSVLSTIKLGYSQRLAADPSFLSKSILEIIFAAATQYTAEVGRRGRHRIVPELDFVFAGVLTAVCGKYFSMWRVAKTVVTDMDSSANPRRTKEDSQAISWRDRVPTNAFQSTLLDGRTKPTLTFRFLALFLPMPELFRAGVIASTIGYGMTTVLIQLRTVFVPEYTVPTVPVPVIGAAIYTGVFMAIVSNVRYQLLQGVIEPYLIEEPFRRMDALGAHLITRSGVTGFVGKLLRWNGWNKVKGLMFALVRWANGLLGSWIAIGGMRACGLQKLKS
jgi:hypothetical protein